jgi:1,2-diacylglycerol 3-beta-glucosyltransferase
MSSYVYLESLVHHRITMYASDRLRIAPGILGSNFCMRRPLLEKVGGFNDNSLTEDIDLTARIYELGYIVKYDVTSVSEHEAPTSIRAYILQHLRWNRGFNQVARSHWRFILDNKRLNILRRIEEILFSLGYLDRFFFFVAFCLTLLSLFILPAFQFPYAVWLIFLGIPAFQILTALMVERERISMYFRLPFVLSMFSIDIYVALIARYQDVVKKPNRWYKTCRAGDDAKTS